MKLTIMCFLLFSILGFQANSCNTKSESNNEMIKFGPAKFTNLAIFFKKGTSSEQIEGFYKTVISVSRLDNKGYDLADGVALQYQIRNGGYDGVGITFSTDATQEQREKLKKAIKESPIVYKVYENVIPNEINDLR